MQQVNYKYDFVVAIGRFEPFHNGHLRVIEEALKIGNQVIIIIGSANSPRTFKNPFSDHERMEMISACLTPEQLARIKFNSTEDSLYQNPVWIRSTEQAVLAIVRDYYPGHYNDAKIAIIGHDKDESTWYINSFPWDVVDIGSHVNNLDSDKPVCATKIRELMFTNHLNYTESQVPKPVFKYLVNFCKNDVFKEVQTEFLDDVRYIDEAHRNISAGIWSTNFITVDNIIIQSGHVLLIKRKFSPGKGLFALPGGHVNANETLADAALRELKEETKIKVPDKVLKGSLVGEKLFDHPNRSLRGRVKTNNTRTVTMTYCYKLDDKEKLPRVTPSDDAAKTDKNWFTFAEIANMRNQLFEDHFDIINYWISRV